MLVGLCGNVDLFALLGLVDISKLHIFVGFDFTLDMVLIGIL